MQPNIPPAAPPSCSFDLDGQSGDLFIRNAAGLIIAQLTPLDQVSLVHLITGAHLQRARELAHRAAPHQVVNPILFPVG